MAYTRKTQTLPTIPVRGLVVFPHMILHFDVAREHSIHSLKESMGKDQLIFLITQRDENLDNPRKEDLYTVGTVAKIKQIIKLPHGLIRVLVEGIHRAELIKITNDSGSWTSNIKNLTDLPILIDEVDQEALARQLDRAVSDYLHENPTGNSEINSVISIPKDIGQAVDTIAANIDLNPEDKIHILEELDPVKRAIYAIKAIRTETGIFHAEKKIITDVREQMEDRQREYFLREQLHRIKEELGEENAYVSDADGYRKKMDSIPLPEYAREKLEKEITKLDRMAPGMAEIAVLQNYIECVLELPWDEPLDEESSIQKAEKILEEDHFGLKDVKDRILEYLSVRQLSNSPTNQILYLVGPPGVGKTSVAKSVARALGRKFERISLGGVKDESEIRGHRKTYVGAMPGRIINAMRHAGTKNPVILLDEIDKMSSDFRGDPSAALLEVLDFEQNKDFRDHYLEMPYDLSNCIFIATANNSDTVPRPLLDRMETIEMSTYTPEEKLHIAQKYLIPKELKRHGLTRENVFVRKSAIEKMISSYTKESGVRGLERLIAKIFRKVAREIVSGHKETIYISSQNLAQYLGPSDEDEKISNFNPVGVVTGLAWTQVGGTTLSVEVNIVEGTGKLELTGSLGNVMKESCQAALSYVRSRGASFGISKDFYQKNDIHIHVPEGATPKDGPSAGITIATAIISALTDIPVNRFVAMTGEITIRGRVLPIGGLKEKLIAARQYGAKTVIIPKANGKDLHTVPDSVKASLNFVFADTMDEVLTNALVTAPIPLAEPINIKKVSRIDAHSAFSGQIGGSI